MPMITDIYIEDDFITEEERLQVRQFVLDHESYWDDHNTERYSGINFKTLGNAVYIMEPSGLQVSDINQDTKTLLKNNLDWLYQRLCNKITELSGVKTQLHPELTVPGFHIAEPNNSMTDDTIAFFHQDMSILSYDAESNMDSNRSVLIAIELPSMGSYLLCKDTDDEVKKLHYKNRAFHQWDARMEHKIGGQTLLSGEHRITLQCHYYYNENLQCNLVYF